MTVSNVINGKQSSVGETTRRRVQLAIERLGYRPQANGRGLRLSKRLSIGLLIVDDSPTFLADPYTTQLVAGLSNYLSEHGYSLTVQGVSPSRFDSALAVRNVGTDGLCVFSSGTNSQRRILAETLASLQQPVILFQEHLAIAGDNFCRILQDDRGGAAQLAAHLTERGARRIAILNTKRVWPAFSEREHGFRQGFKHSGDLTSIDRIVCRSSSLIDTQAALHAYVGDIGIPDAVCGGNDQMGIAAIQYFQGRGIGVPTQVRVTGFNAFEFRHYASPLLTTVTSPAYEIGALGAEQLVRKLTNDTFAFSARVLPVTLALGGST